MKFQYTARNKKGERQTGYVEAATQEAALNLLRGYELFVLHIGAVREGGIVASIVNFFNRVKRTDLMIFTRQFATLLEAKVPLSDALKNLHSQTKNVTLREVILAVSADVEAGISLSQALERHSAIFSEFYVNLIRSAEITGRMEEVMHFLADFLEREILLTSRVRNAMTYPVVVISLFVVVAGILVGVVFPQITPLFEDTDVELPLITRVLLVVGTFIANWWVALIIAFVILLLVALDYFRSPEGKLVKDQLSIQLPLFGNLFRKMYVARFAEASSILLKGGVPAAQAIEISGHTLGNSIYRDLLRESAEGVRRGELLSQTLAAREEYFPALVAQMIAIGETTGKLDQMFERVSNFYTREVNAIVDNLVELIQPILMIVIGVLVGLLFASILLPIYNLAQTF